MQALQDARQQAIGEREGVRVDQLREELNHHSHQLKEKFVEHESMKKELSVKNKLILQLKHDLQSLKNGSSETTRKQLELERHLSKINSLTLDNNALQERNQMLC